MRKIRIALTVMVAVGTLVGPATSARAGGFCHGEPVTDRTGTTVDIKDACFFPTILRVASGSKVTWTNRDAGVPHTVTGANASWGSYDAVNGGKSVSIRFDTAGVYPYACIIHPGMVGAIV